ncbi:hypothetical protein CDAR_528531 [Caerostris darwini]|uniref:Uncharacterized protein n=1 Tax=Caerostris darwini TaxID=1538125 RepID=A0AAV4P310_9ARAC|nr:hypothetical protein CDAR_528531 [Caerostris darwini]
MGLREKIDSESIDPYSKRPLEEEPCWGGEKNFGGSEYVLWMAALRKKAMVKTRKVIGCIDPYSKRTLEEDPVGKERRALEEDLRLTTRKDSYPRSREPPKGLTAQISHLSRK